MKSRKGSDKETATLLHQLPSGSRYAESFRTLRTNLAFSSLNRELNTVLVTSAVEAEGKTNTVINLAYTITRSGSRVLMIDADLRRPRLTGLLSSNKQFGFSDIISKAFARRVDSGTLAKYSIADLFTLTHLQRRTGELQLDAQNYQIGIYFTDGTVVDIHWKNRPEQRKLAHTLIKKNLLTDEEASLALDQQKKSVHRLGSLLFSLGLVSKEELAKELSFHTLEVVRIISGLTTGTFKFITGNQSSVDTLVRPDVDFDALFQEFLEPGKDSKYITESIESALYSTEVENLHILPSGNIPPNPSELIGSPGVDFLLGHLKNQFDFIILDSPPVMPATDALLMAPRTDGTILVVKSGNTERKIVKDVAETFRKANLPILGVLLNQVNLKKEGYYRYYKKYYSSYYGEKT